MAGSKKTKKELIEAVEALQESEKKWHSLAENAPNIIMVVDRDGIIQFVNRTPPDFTIEEAIGKNIYDYLSPEHCKVAKEAIEQVFQTGKPTHYENIGPGPHGRDSWYDTQVGAIRSDGHVVAVTLFVNDITKRKRAEEELREHTDKVKERTRNLGKRVKELKCLYSISNLLQKPGLSLQEILQHTVNFIPPSWQYPEIACARIIFENQEFITKNCRERGWKQKQASDIIVNGEKVGYVEVCYLQEKPEQEEGPFSKEEKNLLNAIAERLGRIAERKKAEEALQKTRDELEWCVEQRTVELAKANEQLQLDITERKKAEEAMRAERNKAQRYLDIAGVMLIVVNSEQAVKLINKRGCEILGYKEEEIIGKNWFDNFVPERSRDEVEKIFQRLIAGEVEPIEYYENPVITKSGEEKIIAWHNTVLKNEQGDTVGTLSSAQDITEFKQIERLEHQHQAELAHFSRLSTIGEMSSALAHELNQPLCAIASSAKAALRMMKSGDWDSNELLEAMQEAGAQAERAGKIVNRITKLVRKKEPHRSSVNIENIIDEVIALIEHEALLREITIQLVEPSEKLPMLEADAIQIEQVLLNLLRNSFDAMENVNKSKKQITIEVLVDKDDAVQVAISDTGHGLPAENIDRVFEHFFTTKSGGLGMGLSISRSIIEAHGGRIWAERNPAGGATFRFTLPTERRTL